MAKFYIMSALKSEQKKTHECDSKVILVFNAENVRNTSIHGCVVEFRCNGFEIDEEKSIGKWNDAFRCSTEGNDKVVITINPDYKRGVIMPYFG